MSEDYEYCKEWNKFHGFHFCSVFALPFLLLPIFTLFVLYSSYTLEINHLSSCSFEDSSDRTFRFLKVDSLRNDTTMGIMRTNNNQFRNNFLIEEDANVKTLLYFDYLGTNEYFCTGSCYCSSNQRRRSSRIYSKPVVSGLLFLFSAVSVLVALESAKDYFSIECSKYLQDQCDPENIHSIVDECKLVLDEDLKPPKKETFFECLGRCSFLRMDDREEYQFFLRDHMDELLKDEDFWGSVDKNQLFMKGQYPLHKSAKDLDEYERMIEIESNIAWVLDLMASKVCKKLELRLKFSVDGSVGRFEYQEEMAIITFVSVHLNKFCKSSSVHSLEELSKLPFPNSFNEAILKHTNEFQETLIGRFFSVVGVDAITLCRGSRSDERIGPGTSKTNVVCYRQFSDEEWENGIPYESENLRHWKEGHMRVPDA